jgi:hypothetical protein
MLFGAGAGWLGIGVVFALPLVALLVASLRASRARSHALAQAIDLAWRSAARDVVLSAKNGITTEGLTQLLPISADAAEHLLTELTIEDSVSSHITDEGQIVFTPGLRIAASPAAGDPAAGLGLDAELEALAAEHEAARERQQR